MLFWGHPWPSSGSDSVLPQLAGQIQSLVEELRSYMPHSTAEKKKKLPVVVPPVGLPPPRFISRWNPKLRVNKFKKLKANTKNTI